MARTKIPLCGCPTQRLFSVNFFVRRARRDLKLAQFDRLERVHVESTSPSARDLDREIGRALALVDREADQLGHPAHGWNRFAKVAGSTKIAAPRSGTA